MVGEGGSGELEASEFDQHTLIYILWCVGELNPDLTLRTTVSEVGETAVRARPSGETNLAGEDDWSGNKDIR